MRYPYALMALFILIGCETIPVEVPVVEQKYPIEIKDSGQLAAIKFDRVGIKIKRGAAIGSYEPNMIGLNGCTGFGGNIFWNSGRVLAKDLEFTDTFFEVMKKANFNVVGDPDKMFAQNVDKDDSVDFLIGGQIEEIKMNVCDEMSIWTGIPLQRQKGKGAVKIRWQVFSLFERKVVYETVTQGATKLETGVANGEILIVQEAFAAATENLSADQALVKLLTNFEPEVAASKSTGDTVVIIAGYRKRIASITSSIDDTRLAVVTIDAGAGHGSGFFVSPTLILTNKHVVGDREFVRIQLLTGRKLKGEVIRRHPARDVALIQVEPTAIIPLPIRDTPLKITEEVYAVGSPLLKKLSGTVTKGIVSKFLLNRRGLEDIQADVDIQGGNSGGALLDASGNVVGISYAGYGGQTSIGINLFIPILDALSKLNMRISNSADES